MKKNGKKNQKRNNYGIKEYVISREEFGHPTTGFNQIALKITENDYIMVNNTGKEEFDVDTLKEAEVAGHLIYRLIDQMCKRIVEMELQVSMLQTYIGNTIKNRWYTSLGIGMNLFDSNHVIPTEKFEGLSMDDCLYFVYKFLEVYYEWCSNERVCKDIFDEYIKNSGKVAA